MTSSLFVLADLVTPVLPRCLATWAYRAAKLSAGHVWTRSPFLGRERDQGHLLDSAASADSELRRLPVGVPASALGKSEKHAPSALGRGPCSLKVPSEERNLKAARPSDFGFSRHEGIVSACVVMFASLRRQRDQARLLDPAASPDPKHRAEVERVAD